MNPGKPRTRTSGDKKYENRDNNDKNRKNNESKIKSDSKNKNFRKETSSKTDFNKKKDSLAEDKNKRVPYNRTNRKSPVLINDKNNSSKDNKTESVSKDRKPNFKNERPNSKYASNRSTDKSEQRAPVKSRIARPKDDGIRLNKYIANAGICSRRDADLLIQSGNVTINGSVITEMGSKVYPGDKVGYDGKLLINEKKVYVLLNKPKDFITTSDDPQKRRTVLSLISGACKERIYPVGRLDRMTTGVLLFTNDGDLTKKLTHPKHGVNKVYHVVLDKNLTKTDMMKIIEGVELEDGIVDVDKVSYAGDAADKKEIGIELHSGKNRIVRRLFETIGYNVVKLDRVSFAGLTKKNLKKGQWRFLTTKEVSFLNMLK